MDLLYSLLLGLVQGLTEFLPVSSSGHLLLFGRIFGFTPSVAFEIVAHLGTLVAVVTVYRSRIASLAFHPLKKPTLVIVFATAVTAALVVVFENPLRSTFDGKILPYAFLATAILLTLSSLIRPKRFKTEVGFFEGFMIGVSQAAAVIPGLSRSGTTMSSARLLGVDSKQSADFSFLLSIPIIIVSALGELIRHGDEFLHENVFCLLIVFLASALSGFIAIKLVLKTMQKGRLGFFSVYLVALSVLLFLNDMFFHLI